MVTCVCPLVQVVLTSGRAGLLLRKSFPQPPRLGTSHPFLLPTKHLFRMLRARHRAREAWLMFKPHLSRSLVGTNSPKSRWMGSFLPQLPWDRARGRGTGQVQALRIERRVWGGEALPDPGDASPS